MFGQYNTSSKMLHKVVHITDMYSIRFILLLQKNKGKDISNYNPMTTVGLTYNGFKQETGGWQW
jgi:hypothetical protein